MLNLNGEDKRLNDIDEIITLACPVYIWGYGTYANVIKDYLNEKGVERIQGFVVDDEYYADDCNEQIPLSCFLEHNADCSVLVFGFYNYEIIQKKKAQYGHLIKYMYEFHLTSLDTRRLKWDIDDAVGKYDCFMKTYNLLSDEKSKMTMQLYLRAAILGEFEQLYNNCHFRPAYFNDITKHVDVDVLVDCGAFDGDSIHDFVFAFPKYKKIYAVEPDNNNINAMKQRITNEKIHDVTIVPKGVYKETTELHFSADGKSSSHLSENGDFAVPVVAIDELLKDENRHIMIKMDIEGSELDALRGASKTITQKHPCLAICVYHKESDLIDIPQYIDSLVEKETYHYYLGFHGDDLAEFVFYAIPRDNL